ncbi:hypothetical protein D0Z00_004564 [Geotrichum galactomycetum]|uniref:Uncharacterized protein n=1 Tax=Geotrichum galactomycetum TaxID=27317 RepID=A0ACB6UY29_9ASCO|nr:hypothetical protein D0Z00_004564 [Geotrichum candidum]
MSSNNTNTLQIAVIGSGLAGLTTTLSLAESGKVSKIHLFEKEGVLGFASNSNKASSGINGVLTAAQQALGIVDTKEEFYNDTLKSGKNLNDPVLVQELVDESKAAIEWVNAHSDEELSHVAKLGGHSKRRTHRYPNGSVGYSMIKGLTEKILNDYKDIVEVHLKSQVTKLVPDANGAIQGLQYTVGDSKDPVDLLVNNVVLATGGFSQNRDLLQQYGGAKLNSLPSSNSVGTTGDGLQLTKDLGVELIGMEFVQIHPTGFINPEDPTNTHKILAGEVLRGIGGILINNQGERFVNELDTRDNVSTKVIAEQERTGGPQIYLVVPCEIADKEIPTHLKFYSFKNLLKEKPLSNILQPSALATLNSEFANINKLKGLSADRFNRTDFNGQTYSTSGRFYIGQVTPVVHFCMGGIKINIKGQILRSAGGAPVPGLYAAGEVTGGIHGANRLGGSSLLECVVFGRKIAQTLLSKL